MADQRGMRGIGLAFIQQRFEPSGWTIEKERFDSVRHNSFYQRMRLNVLAVVFLKISSAARDPF